MSSGRTDLKGGLSWLVLASIGPLLWSRRISVFSVVIMNPRYICLLSLAVFFRPRRHRPAQEQLVKYILSGAYIFRTERKRTFPEIMCS